MNLSSLLGVFLFPALAGEFIPDRSSPEPLSGPDAAWEHPAETVHPWEAAVAVKPRAASRPRREPAARGPAPVLPGSMVEIERMGEELRDAVAPLPTLERFLSDIRGDSAAGRSEAVGIFAYPGNFAAIPYVSAVLFRVDEESAVRVAAAEGLGRVGDYRAWRFLARALGDPDAMVGAAAARALGRVMGSSPGGRRALERGRVGGLQAAAALARPLRHPQPLVRAAAALALSREPSAAGAALLEDALGAENDGAVRGVLAWALARVRPS